MENLFKVSNFQVQLLNEMEGQLEYETTVDGLPPKTFYTITGEIN